MGCWRCQWCLNLPCHKAGPSRQLLLPKRLNLCSTTTFTTQWSPSCNLYHQQQPPEVTKPWLLSAAQDAQASLTCFFDSHILWDSYMSLWDCMWVLSCFSVYVNLILWSKAPRKARGKHALPLPKASQVELTTGASSCFSSETPVHTHQHGQVSGQTSQSSKKRWPFPGKSL